MDTSKHSKPCLLYFFSRPVQRSQYGNYEKKKKKLPLLFHYTSQTFGVKRTFLVSGRDTRKSFKKQRNDIERRYLCRASNRPCSTRVFFRWLYSIIIVAAKILLWRHNSRHLRIIICYVISYMHIPEIIKNIIYAYTKVDSVITKTNVIIQECLCANAENRSVSITKLARRSPTSFRGHSYNNNIVCLFDIMSVN